LVRRFQYRSRRLIQVEVRRRAARSQQKPAPAIAYCLTAQGIRYADAAIGGARPNSLRHTAPGSRGPIGKLVHECAKSPGA